MINETTETRETDASALQTLTEITTANDSTSARTWAELSLSSIAALSAPSLSTSRVTGARGRSKSCRVTALTAADWKATACEEGNHDGFLRVQSKFQTRLCYVGCFATSLDTSTLEKSQITHNRRYGKESRADAGQQPAPASKKTKLRSRTKRAPRRSGSPGPAAGKPRPPAHPSPAPCRRCAHLPARPRPWGAAHGRPHPSAHVGRSRSPRARCALSLLPTAPTWQRSALRFHRPHRTTRRSPTGPPTSPPHREGCRNAPAAHAQNTASSRLLGAPPQPPSWQREGLVPGGSGALGRAALQGAPLGPVARRWTQGRQLKGGMPSTAT